MSLDSRVEGAGSPVQPLCDRVLIACGLPHGFGQKGSQVPDLTCFPTQVHGTKVFFADLAARPSQPEADVIVSKPGDACFAVGIVTADCVPVLVGRSDGSVVGAIHAGWRGLAAGVIEAGLAAVGGSSGPHDLVTAVGPAARACCYEVDSPVCEALSARYSALIDDSILRPAGPGHSMLDLSGLVARVLESSGIPTNRIGLDQQVCTICDGERFESYRREGSSAGRLRHYIETRDGGRSRPGGKDSLEG